MDSLKESLVGVFTDGCNFVRKTAPTWQYFFEVYRAGEYVVLAVHYARIQLCLDLALHGSSGRKFFFAEL